MNRRDKINKFKENNLIIECKTKMNDKSPWCALQSDDLVHIRLECDDLTWLGKITTTFTFCTSEPFAFTLGEMGNG